MVHLRPTLAEGHVEPVFLVDAGGDRLIVAAVLGLGLPVGAERYCLRPGGNGEGKSEKERDQRARQLSRQSGVHTCATRGQIAMPPL